MKVVYHCFGGAHASPTAAAIHLGVLPDNKIPRYKDFKKVSFYDQNIWKEHGKLIKVGIDKSGNEIFCLARRNYPELTINIIKEFVCLTGGNLSEYYFVNCLQPLNLLMGIGGYASRALGLINFGRPIVTFGTIISFPFLVAIVKRTMFEIENFKKPAKILK